MNVEQNNVSSDMQKQVAKITATSILISLVLVAVPIYLYIVGMAQLNGDKLFFEAVFFWFLGLIFIFSSRYASKVFLLYVIHYAFSTFAVIGGRYRTYIYGAAFLIVGAIQAYRWLTPPS